MADGGGGFAFGLALLLVAPAQQTKTCRGLGLRNPKNLCSSI